MKIKDIRKEYGVDGYVDYVAEIRAGKVVHTVHFSGGTESGYGRTPAKFATSDIALQFIIERSKQFKTGKIRLLSGKPWAPAAPVRASVPASVSNCPPVPSAPVRELQPESPAPEVPPAISAPVRELQPEAPAPEASQGRERVECATLGDAQIVLKERFGVASSRAHNREKAIALGKQNGIEIIFK